MAGEYSGRQHRISLPAIPTSDDPKVLKRAMEKNNQLIQDEFNRLAGDLFKFKREINEAAIIPLRGVSMITLTVSEYAVSAVWENPQQQDMTPTHVRVRIEELTPNDWAEYTYPMNTWSFSGLIPDTQYTLQVQLIARFETTDTFVSTTRNCPSVPVLRTAESPIISKVFTTDDGVGPPVDAGVDDTTVDFPFPDIGSCTYDYQFQWFNSAWTVLAWEDIGSLTTGVSGGIGTVQVDLDASPFSAFASGIFRMKYREVCGAVTGDWVYGDIFTKSDFDLACGGLTASDSASEAPYNDADMFTVVPCMEPGSWLKIEDGITGNEYIKQAPGYRGYGRVDGEWSIHANDLNNPAISDRLHQPLITNTLPLIAGLHNASSFSFAIDMYLPTLNANFLAPAWNILNLGNKIKMNIVQNTSTYDVIVTVPRDGGGAYVFRAQDLSTDRWNSVFYVHDVTVATGRALFVNGAEVARSLGTSSDNDFNGIDGSFLLNTFDLTRFRKIYGWLRAVDASELDTAPAGEFYYSIAGDEPVVDLDVGDVVIYFTMTSGLTPSPTFGSPTALGSQTWEELEILGTYNPSGLGEVHGRSYVTQVTSLETGVTLEAEAGPGRPAIYVIYRGLIPTAGAWQDHIQVQVSHTRETTASFSGVVTTANGPSIGQRLMLTAATGGASSTQNTITWTNGETTEIAGVGLTDDDYVSLVAATTSDCTADFVGSWDNAVATATWSLVVDVRRETADPFVAAIRHISNLSYTAALATSVALTVPSTPTTGDILIVALMSRGTVTAPSGWTLLGSNTVVYTPGGFTIRVSIYAARQGVDTTITSGGTVTFSQSINNRINGALMVFRTTDGSFDMSPTTGTGSTTAGVDAGGHPHIPAIATHPRGIALTVDSCAFGADIGPDTADGWTEPSMMSVANFTTTYYKSTPANSNNGGTGTHTIGGGNTHTGAAVTAILTGE